MGVEASQASVNGRTGASHAQASHAQAAGPVEEIIVIVIISPGQEQHTVVHRDTWLLWIFFGT